MCDECWWEYFADWHSMLDSEEEAIIRDLFETDEEDSHGSLLSPDVPAMLDDQEEAIIMDLPATLDSEEEAIIRDLFGTDDEDSHGSVLSPVVPDQGTSPTSLPPSDDIADEFTTSGSS